LFALGNQALDWQSLFAVLLCGGTVRMAVEYYGTLRETLICHELKHGKREDALPCISKIQRAIMPLMRSSLYARSEVVTLQKRNGGTDNVPVVVPSKWAILDTCTTPPFDVLFSPPSSAFTASGPSFVFDNKENKPIVRHKKSVVNASSYIFVEANQEGDEARSADISVPAGPGDCIEVEFISSIEADSILGLEIYADVQA
jgi:hypothetical protein